MPVLLLSPGRGSSRPPGALPASGELSALAHVGAAGWAQLLHLALFCSVFAFLAQTWAVQRTSASRAGLLLGTEPIWAAAVGIGLAGDHFTPLTALGATLMVSGTYWGQSTERAHRTALSGAQPTSEIRALQGRREPRDKPQPTHG